MIAHTLTRLARANGLALACLLIVGAAVAQQPSPAAVTAARELISVEGGDKMFEGTVPGIIAQTEGMIMQMNPALAKDLDEVGVQLMTEFAPRRAQLLNDIAVLYAQRFTEQELKDAIAFYKSPLGRKLTSEKPALLDASAARANEWARGLSEEIMKRFSQEMRKKGHNL
jgi:hypothetical protein